MRPESGTFQVGLSYAREIQRQVRPIAERLVELLGPDTVFFDQLHSYNTARANLNGYLHDIYHHCCRLVVVILSPKYRSSKWCSLEWRVVRHRIHERLEDQVMLLRVGNVGSADFPDGWLSIDHAEPIDEKSADETAALIVKRLRSLDPPGPSWLAYLQNADTVEIRVKGEPPPVRALLVSLANELAPPGEEPPSVVLVLPGSDAQDDAPALGVYERTDKGEGALLAAIDAPADEVLARWIGVLSYNRMGDHLRSKLESAAQSTRSRAEELLRRIPMVAIGLLGDALDPEDDLFDIPVGAPRSETGFGSDYASAGKNDLIFRLRRAVDSQDHRAIQKLLRRFGTDAQLPQHIAAELDLYRAISAFHGGDPTAVRRLLEGSAATAPPEARLRTALSLLHLGGTAYATSLVETATGDPHPVLELVAATIRLWIGAIDRTSSGPHNTLERLDALAKEAAESEPPPMLWLCLVRLALRLGDVDRASHWLERIEENARTSIDYFHVAAITAMTKVVQERLGDPHRSSSAAHKEQLIAAISSLENARAQWESLTGTVPPDVMRDLGTALEILSRFHHGTAREKALIDSAQAYEEAAAADASLAHLRARAGRCWLVTGHHRRALEAFNSVAAEHLNATQRSDLAAAYLLCGQTEDAMKTMTSLLDKEIAPWQALFNAAIVLHLTAHDQTALHALEQARAKGGQENWRIEAMLGLVYEGLDDVVHAERSYRQALYGRARPDVRLHRSYAAAFQRGTAKGIVRLVTRMRALFQRHHARSHSLDRLKEELKRSVGEYLRRIDDLAQSGPEPPKLVTESLQGAFEALNALEAKLRRLGEIENSRERWPPEAIIDAVDAILSSADASWERDASPVTAPAHEATADSDGYAIGAPARAVLARLAVPATLVEDDPGVLRQLCQPETTATTARAHRLNVAARAFEIETSTPLRCFHALLDRDGVGPLVHKAYQERVVQRVFSHMRGRAILADEVGLGKTIEAGLILTEYRLRRLVGRCLVLVPTRDLAKQWQRELETKLAHHAPFPWRVGQHRPGRATAFDRYDTWVATYDAAIRNREQYLEAGWDLVIADEAHHVTNRSTQRYKLLVALKSRHVLLLTATPLHRGIDDLYSLGSIVLPGLELRAFRALFDDDPEDGKRHGADRLLYQIMIRNSLLAVADQVFTGRRVFKNVPVRMSEAEADFYKDAMNLVLAIGKSTSGARLPPHYYWIAKMSSSSARATVGAVANMERSIRLADSRPHSRRITEIIVRGHRELRKRLARIGTPAKIRVLREILGEIGSRKALIFVEFRDTALQVEEVLGIPAIHGGLSEQRRHAMIEAFAKDPNQRAVVATGGLSEGLNLAFCSVLVNYDLPWNPMRIEQRIGRIQRIGQRQPEVLIYSLAASDTIEEEIRACLVRKVNVFERVVGQIGLDLALLTDGRRITTTLQRILKEASDIPDLRQRVARFFAEYTPPVISEGSP